MFEVYKFSQNRMLCFEKKKNFCLNVWHFTFLIFFFFFIGKIRLSIKFIMIWDESFTQWNSGFLKIGLKWICQKPVVRRNVINGPIKTILVKNYVDKFFRVRLEFACMNWKYHFTFIFWDIFKIDIEGSFLLTKLNKIHWRCSGR